MKAGFSVTDLVILEKIPSCCDVPYEVMYFQFKCFEIIPTMMHLCCFLPTEKDFFDKCPWFRHTLYPAK